MDEVIQALRDHLGQQRSLGAQTTKGGTTRVCLGCDKPRSQLQAEAFGKRVATLLTQRVPKSEVHQWHWWIGRPSSSCRRWRTLPRSSSGTARCPRALEGGAADGANPVSFGRAGRGRLGVVRRRCGGAVSPWAAGAGATRRTAEHPPSCGGRRGRRQSSVRARADSAGSDGRYQRIGNDAHLHLGPGCARSAAAVDTVPKRHVVGSLRAHSPIDEGPTVVLGDFNTPHGVDSDSAAGCWAEEPSSTSGGGPFGALPLVRSAPEHHRPRLTVRSRFHGTCRRLPEQAAAPPQHS